MNRLVCALFEDRSEADRAVDLLLDEGMDRNLVDVVVHTDTVDHQDVDDSGNKQSLRMAQGAAIGAAAGAAVGALVGGPLGMAGGAAMAAAAFGATGSVYGAVAGVLTGRDTDREDVQRLAQAVENGAVMVTVNVEGVPKADEVAERLRVSGAHEVLVA